MRIQVMIQKANADNTSVLELWETLTVNNHEEAKAHCHHVLRYEKDTVIIGTYYFVIE